MADTIHHKRIITNSVLYLTPFLCLLILGFILNTTNPLEAGPLSILGVFVVIYLLIFSVFVVILRISNAMWRVMHSGHSIPMRRWYYVMSIIALAPVMLIALNTLGQLEALEFGLIITLISLGCFYVLRRVKI